MRQETYRKSLYLLDGVFLMEKNIRKLRKIAHFSICNVFYVTESKKTPLVHSFLERGNNSESKDTLCNLPNHYTGPHQFFKE